METLTDRELYARLVPEVLTNLARPHAETPGNNLAFLPEDPELYPVSQKALDPFCFHIEGTVASREDLDQLATNTEPRFPGMVRALAEQPNTTPVIKTAGELLEAGNNIWITTPHGNITDIAYMLKIVGNFLDDQDYKPASTSIVISKMLAKLGYQADKMPGLIETVGVLSILCTDTFLTWPRTDSAKAEVAKLPETEVNRHNQAAIDGILGLMKRGGMLGVVAPSGTTRMERDENGAYKLRSPSDGTIDLMMQPKTYVLPVAAWFRSKVPILSFCSEPLRISTPEEAEKMMKLMTDALTEQVEGLSFSCQPRARRLGQTAIGA